MEPHPLQAPEILDKEPTEIGRYTFDLSENGQMATQETVTQVVSVNIEPSEEHHRIQISAITGGPFLAGEPVTTPDGDTASVVNDTADGATSIDLYVGTAVQLGSGDTITGQHSGATAVLEESNSVGTKIDEGVQFQSSEIDSTTGRRFDVFLRKGLRPLAGAPWRQYLVKPIFSTSRSQQLTAIGRIRVPEAAEPNNAR